MRVVLDTNVFVSGIHWKGSSELILRKWFLGRFELVSSVPIVDELVATLKSFKIPLPAEDILWWESLILSKSSIVSPSERIDAVKRDPDDNKFIETAQEGKADFIVSQDRHLLDIVAYKNIKIISPKEFLNRLHQE